MKAKRRPNEGQTKAKRVRPGSGSQRERVSMREHNGGYTKAPEVVTTMAAVAAAAATTTVAAATAAAACWQQQQHHQRW